MDDAPGSDDARPSLDSSAADTTETIDATETPELVTSEPGPPLVVPPESHGRAGRNLGAAAAVGVGLGLLVIASLLFFRLAFAVFVAAAIVVAVLELSKAFGVIGITVAREVLVVGAVAMVLGAYLWGPSVLLASFAVTAVACLAERMRHGSSGFVRDVTASVFVAAYGPVLAGFAVMLASGSDGFIETLVFIATVVASDVGGYAAGVLFGKHPMAPKISPKKSWEGFAGSVVACLLTAGLLVGLATSFPWWSGLVIGALVVCTATGGDLVESMIKRDIGVKDMGDLLPGHGGIMDRLDSMLPSALACWLVFTLLG